MTSLEERFTYAVYLRSTPQQVFDALTVPELTRQYWVDVFAKPKAV